MLFSLLLQLFSWLSLLFLSLLWLLLLLLLMVLVMFCFSKEEKVGVLVLIFLSIFSLQFFAGTEIWFFLPLLLLCFFRREDVYRNVSFVEVRLFVWAMIVDSMDVIAKGVNVSWFWWQVDNRLCLDSDGVPFNGLLIFWWWDRRIFCNLPR